MAVNGTARPDWGRDHILALAYDSTNKILWAAGRGTSNQNIMSRWIGTPSNQGLFGYLDPTTGQAVGIASNANFHASPGYPPAGTGPDYWVNTIAVNPASGEAWMGFSGMGTFTANRGKVVGRPTTTIAPGGDDPIDEGTPEANADVVALVFGADSTGRTTAYASVLNMNTA